MEEVLQKVTDSMMDRTEKTCQATDGLIKDLIGVLSNHLNK
jgi:hypothetical protein